MKLKALEETYITAPDIARELGVSTVRVHSWLKYFRYMPVEYVFGKPIVARSDYEKFKTERPDLKHQKAA